MLSRRQFALGTAYTLHIKGPKWGLCDRSCDVLLAVDQLLSLKLADLLDVVAHRLYRKV